MIKQESLLLNTKTTITESLRNQIGFDRVINLVRARTCTDNLTISISDCSWPFTYYMFNQYRTMTSTMFDQLKKAVEILTKKANIRLLELPTINSPIKDDSYDMKKVVGGLLIQNYDDRLMEELQYVTNAKPSESEIEDLKFAYKVVKHTKSNAIVVAKNKTTLGIGAGQTNRVWACAQAIEHSIKPTKGAVLASDAFFPFPDCVELAAKAGIKTIIQPGGSIRDNESIEACNKYGIAMVFCGMRHFKH